MRLRPRNQHFKSTLGGSLHPAVRGALGEKFESKNQREGRSEWTDSVTPGKEAGTNRRKSQDGKLRPGTLQLPCTGTKAPSEAQLLDST